MKPSSFVPFLAALLTTLSAPAPGAESTAVAAPTASVFGKLEMRPTWATESGNFDAQNSVELGYQFQPDLKLLYNQGFNVDLYKQGKSSWDVTLPDARLELDANNVWRSDSRSWSLDLQPRLHLPVDSRKRDNGFLTALKAQANLNHRASDRLAIQLSVAPTAFAYSQAGGTFENAPAANPVFENAVELIPKYSFTSRLKLEVPVKFSQSRHMRFDSRARFNDRWVFGLTLKPELTYAFTPNLTAGLALETASLVADDLQELTFRDGFRKTLAQFILIASI